MHVKQIQNSPGNRVFTIILSGILSDLKTFSVLLSTIPCNGRETNFIMRSKDLLQIQSIQIRFEISVIFYIPIFGNLLSFYNEITYQITHD